MQPEPASVHPEVSAVALDPENAQDLRMLKEAPEQLLVKYQWLLQYLVSGFVRKGFFTDDDIPDTVQEVNSRLLGGLLTRMAERYDGRSLVRTYLGVVIRSTIADLLKQRRAQKATFVETREELPEARLSEHNTAPANLLLHEEFRRLEIALQLTPRLESKTRFCLALLVRRPFTEKLVRQYWVQVPAPRCAQLVQQLAEYRHWDDKEVWSAVIDLINEAEAKDPTDPDSLRRWVRRRLDWLITVMTGDPPRARYTDDSLMLLLELYFDRKGT
jgi:DNA-directed RNA polymerase specialized sigma24 family protein